MYALVTRRYNTIPKNTQIVIQVQIKNPDTPLAGQVGPILFVWYSYANDHLIYNIKNPLPAMDLTTLVGTGWGAGTAPGPVSAASLQPFYLERYVNSARAPIRIRFILGAGVVVTNGQIYVSYANNAYSPFNNIMAGHSMFCYFKQ